MKRHLKKYFIPHEENEHMPHILREAAVTVLALVALAAFVFSSIHTVLLVSSSDFLAAVLPKVLVDITNERRLENEFSQLSPSPQLTAAAQLKANQKHLSRLQLKALIALSCWRMMKRTTKYFIILLKLENLTA